jgi:hypothetical protein
MPLLTAFEGNVYWCYQDPMPGDVLMLSRDGGTPTRLAQLWASAITATTSGVYFAVAQLAQPQMGAKVYRAPLSGGASDVIATSDDGGYPHALAVDASNVYWGAGSIWSVPLSGGTASKIVPAQTYSLVRVAVEGSALVSLGSSGVDGWVITKTSTAGGTLTTLAQGTGGVAYDMVIDDGFIYYLTGEDVNRLAVTGGAPSKLATGVIDFTGAPPQIATDAASIYWMTSRQGVVRLAK